MLHDIFRVEGQKLVKLGSAMGRHPLEAVRHYRRQAKVYNGQLVAKRTSGLSSARSGISTPVQCKRDPRLKPIISPSPAYYDMRKPEAKEEWADRVASYAADKAHTSHLLGE